MKQTESSRYPFRLLLVVVVLAFFTRMGVSVWRLASFDADPDAYRAISQTLIDHGVYGLVDGQGNPWPTAFRPPLYPVLLSFFGVGAVGSNATLAILHTLLGAATGGLVFATSLHLARQNQARFPVARSRIAAVIGTVLFIVDPILLQQSTVAMTETLATFLVMLTVWSLVRSNESIHWIWLATFALALAFLCRPTFLVWGGFLGIGWWIAGCHSQNHASSVHRLPTMPAQRWPVLLIWGGLVVAVLGWTARNLREFGAPIWATTHGGYTLLLGNNPMFYEYIRQAGFWKAAMWGEPWDTDSFFDAYANRFRGDPATKEFWDQDWSGKRAEFRPQKDNNLKRFQNKDFRLREVRDDQRCSIAALGVIKRDPGMFLRSSLVKFSRVWSPLPHAVKGRSIQQQRVVGGFYCVMYVFVILGMFRLRLLWRSPLIWATLALVLTLSLVHAFYWSNLRMRAPVIPLFAIFAGYGVVAVGSARPTTVEGFDDVSMC